MVELQKIATEQRNPNTMNIDTLSTLDMVKLINELTIYSKIDNDKIPYNFRRINLSDYFGDCVEEIGMDLESRNIELNYSNLLSRDTEIIADPEQFKRVINNIVGNSVKYMDLSLIHI